MLQCDRCVRAEAKHILKLESDDCLFHKWAVCGECLNYVVSESQKAVENYCRDHLREFCPSLTPDQAKQIELYVQSRKK